MSRAQRVAFILICLAFGVGFGIGSRPLFQSIYDSSLGPRADRGPYGPASHPLTIGASAILGLLIGGIVARLIIRGFERLDSMWEGWDRGEKVNLVVGVFGGLILSSPLVFVLREMIPEQYRLLALFGFWLGCVAATIYALRSMGDILPWVKEKGPGKRRNIKILDTNVLIDGRIYDVARTGFLDGSLYVPGFVLDELQHIADSHDGLRRQRGRRGLDVLRMLQADYPTEVRVHDKLASEVGDEVDARLVRLARAMGADIVTNDFNLNRVAVLQQVKVLNLNDLALALRPNVLPTEKLLLAIVREGNQVGQGVGYLEDGTMVVVENGKSHIGETREVTVTQVIQTERGKMIFGEIDEESLDAHGASMDLRRQPKRKYQ